MKSLFFASHARILVYGVTTLGLILQFLFTWAQIPAGLGAWVKALGLMLNVPGMIVLVLAHTGIPESWAMQLMAWFLTLLFFEPVLSWIERPVRRNPKARGEVSRRSFLAGTSACAAATLTGGYATLYEPHHLRLEQYRLSLPDLPAELEGIRLVLMADWHCGPINRPGDLRPAVQLANQCRPHLVLLPGDFISRSGAYFAEAAELAAGLRPLIPRGVLLSWGNHDYWHGLEPGLRWMPQAGCQILTNRCLVLKPSREWGDGGEKGLAIAGLDDLWTGRPDLVGALEGLKRRQPRLVLSHNPDVAEEQNGPRVDLMLSGHTHGGQVRIPALGAPIVPSRYGSKYVRGLVRGPAYPVYITRGVGTGGLPVRFGVPPEVTLFELHRGDHGRLQRARLV